MCGLVGVFGRFMYQQEVTIFKQLLLMSTVRGPQSTGVALIKRDGSLRMRKTATNAWDYLEHPKSDQFFQKADDSVVMMGHNRWATMGEINARNAHPFQHGAITLAHNGSLQNHREISSASAKDIVVDSDHITHAINEKGIDTVLEKVRGAFTFTYHDAESNTFNIIRNDQRPLALMKHSHRDVWFYASEQKMLEWILHRNNVSAELVPTDVGELITFSIREFTLTREKKTLFTFPPYEPTSHESRGGRGYRGGQYDEYWEQMGYDAASKTWYKKEETPPQSHRTPSGSCVTTRYGVPHRGPLADQTSRGPANPPFVGPHKPMTALPDQSRILTPIQQVLKARGISGAERGYANSLPELTASKAGAMAILDQCGIGIDNRFRAYLDNATPYSQGQTRGFCEGIFEDDDSIHCEIKVNGVEIPRDGTFKAGHYSVKLASARLNRDGIMVLTGIDPIFLTPETKEFLQEIKIINDDTKTVVAEIVEVEDTNNLSDVTVDGVRDGSKYKTLTREEADDEMGVHTYYPGYGNQILSPKVYDKLTRHGCARCSCDIGYKDAHELHWLTSDTFLCKDCYVSERVDSTGYLESDEASAAMRMARALDHSIH